MPEATMRFRVVRAGELIGETELAPEPVPPALAALPGFPAVLRGPFYPTPAYLPFAEACRVPGPLRGQAATEHALRVWAFRFELETPDGAPLETQPLLIFDHSRPSDALDVLVDAAGAPLREASVALWTGSSCSGAMEAL